MTRCNANRDWKGHDSEAIARHRNFSPLKSLVPGSWIHANFNVWIGAPEDNRAWDYLSHAREFYAQNAARATEAQRKLAFEEILIAEAATGTGGMGRSTTQPTTAISTNFTASTYRMFTRRWERRLRTIYRSRSRLAKCGRRSHRRRLIFIRASRATKSAT